MLNILPLDTMTLENIKLIGTNHIAQDSLEVIKKEFLSFRPDIIAVELDVRRLEALLTQEQEAQEAKLQPQIKKKKKERSKIDFSIIRRVGVQGFLFLLFGKWLQGKMGKMVGMQPGKEMLYGVQLAKNNNLTLSLIDRFLEKTIRRLFKQLTWKERFRFIGEIFRAPFVKNSAEMKAIKRAWGAKIVNSSSGPSKLKINLAQIPSQDAIISMMTILRKQYPTFYNVLVDERNHYMARQLALLTKKHPEKKIMAVVGAGHLPGIQELLPQYLRKIEVV